VQLHHFSNFREYYRYLLYHRNRDEELTSIIDIITVNETYFFREQNQLRTFSEELLRAQANNKTGSDSGYGPPVVPR
jgi:chemotaxis protein methyltransferase CheR